MKVYKLRNKKTGLYWLGGGYMSRLWGPKGKQYGRISDLKNSLHQTTFKEWRGYIRPPNEDLEIEVYMLVHSETMPYEDV